MMCVSKIIEVEKESTKYPNKRSHKMIIFRPEHAEDISNGYVENEIFEPVSDLFGKQNQKV